MLPGYDAASNTNSPNTATAFIPLKPFEERSRPASAILDEARKAVADIDQARVLIIPPPLIDGIGSAGGYRMMVQDRGGHGYKPLGSIADQLMAKANGTEGLSQVYSFFNTSTPRIFADIDRRKAELQMCIRDSCGA